MAAPLISKWKKPFVTSEEYKVLPNRKYHCPKLWILKDLKRYVRAWVSTGAKGAWHPLILAILLHNVVLHPRILRINWWLAPNALNSQLKPCMLSSYIFVFCTNKVILRCLFFVDLRSADIGMSFQNLGRFSDFLYNSYT